MAGAPRQTQVSEQRAVVLVPNLGKVSDGGLRIRDKLKAILRRRREGRLRCRSHHSHGNRSSGALNEIPSKGLAIVESPFPADARPMNSKRLDYTAYQSERVQRV